MRRIFVSYSRQSETAARRLVEHLETLGHQVWFDHELSGGQAWWDQILASIRDCDVFALVLDTHSLGSTACQREWGYAAALGRPILPVLAGEGVSINLLPPLLSKTQAVDYREPGKVEAALRLARALGSLPPAAALPDPLPAPPEVPMSYLGRVAERVDTAPTLTLEEQSVLLVELRRGLRDPSLAADSRALLKRLRARHDLLQAVAEDLDELLAGAPGPFAASTVPAPAPIPTSMPGPAPAATAAPAPVARAVAAGDPQVVAPSPMTPEPVADRPPEVRPPMRKAELLGWAAGGAVLGIVALGGVSGTVDGLIYLWIAAPTAAAVVGRLIARRTGRGTGSLVAGAVIGFAIGALVGGPHDWLPAAGLLGAPAGAVLLPLLERLLPAARHGTQPA